MSELKPCPFCGSDNLYIHAVEYDPSLHILRCCSCGIEFTVPVKHQIIGNVYSGKRLSNKERLIESWNRRWEP